jgi:hypothetical protein
MTLNNYQEQQKFAKNSFTNHELFCSSWEDWPCPTFGKQLVNQRIMFNELQMDASTACNNLQILEHVFLPVTGDADELSEVIASLDCFLVTQPLS